MGLGSVDGIRGSGREGFLKFVRGKPPFSHRLRRTLPPKEDTPLCNPR